MPQTIEVVVRLTISEEDFDVNRLEERVKQARDEAGRELLVKALEVLEEEALAAHAGAVRQRDTSLGHVVFRRWRVKAGGKTTCLLDHLLGLERHSRARPAVKKRGGELASRMTYREAGAVLSEELGTLVSAQSVHRWVQPLGDQVAAGQSWPPRGLPSPSPRWSWWSGTIRRCPARRRGNETFP